MIEVEGLTRSYRKGDVVTEVLRGVSFRLEPGEFVAIMGPSGSGKSTLLNLLGFLDRPDGGRYLLDGQDYGAADDDTLSAVRNRTIGFVFQQFHLLDRATALENVMLPLLYTPEEDPEGPVRAERGLAAVGLAHRMHHYPGEMSGGEQQRVAIARALINDPRLILADEPTGNLDAATGSGILELLHGLTEERRSVVMVTHDRDVAARADRLLVLERGRIVQDGRVGDGTGGG